MPESSPQCGHSPSDCFVCAEVLISLRRLLASLQPGVLTLRDAAVCPLRIPPAGAPAVGAFARDLVLRRGGILVRQFPSLSFRLLLIDLPKAAPQVFSQKRRHQRDGRARGGDLLFRDEHLGQFLPPSGLSFGRFPSRYFHRRFSQHFDESGESLIITFCIGLK